MTIKKNNVGEGCASRESATPPRDGTEAVQHPDRARLLTVAYRRQTPEEERQYSAALDIFLTDLIREQLDRTKAQ